ncbi:hypothetical protein V6N13_042898 [Hibiscus sabdariffa]|uniref:Uncharacterized protein n=1 Tax=Hibiscus sabdariffa TaxID=183260 RepID=A0ABR2G388_9ROSI
MFAICAIADNIGLKFCVDVYWKSKVWALTVNNVQQLKNDLDAVNMLEFVPTNQNVHIYLVEKTDKELHENVGEGVSEVEEVRKPEKDANVEESDKPVEEVREPEKDANFEETYETVGEELSEPEKDANEDGVKQEVVPIDTTDATIEKDVNDTIGSDESEVVHDAHDAATEKDANEAAVEKDVVPTETTDTTIEKDVNDTHDTTTTNDAHNATINDTHEIREGDWVDVEDVEEDAYSN